MSKRIIVIAVLIGAILVMTVIAGISFLGQPSHNAPANNVPINTTPPKVVLKVNGGVTNGYWTRDVATDLPDYESTVSYSVSDVGNLDASSVSISISIDGSPYSSNVIPSITTYNSYSSSFSYSTPYDSRNQILIQASCLNSVDSYTFTVGSDLPRYWSDDTNVVKLFVTPREANLVEMNNNIINDKFFLLPNWIALRDWVGNNIKYKYDIDVHGQGEFWQLSKETLGLRTGDCEDFAILLCSLLRADGWSPNDAFVVLGKNSQNEYHAWIKINLGILGWYNLEPQENGWSTLIGDFLSLSGYTAMYEFNDSQFKQIG